MTTPTIESVSPSKIAEVKAFVKAKEAIEELWDRYPDAFRHLAELARVYNATLKVAEAAVRKRAVSSGPFDLYELRAEYDAEALYEGVGRQLFAQLGGKLETVENKSIEKDRFEAFVAQGRIAAGLLAKVRSYGPRFHAPKAIVLP